jgi:flagellar protein FlaG
MVDKERGWTICWAQRFMEVNKVSVTAVSPVNSMAEAKQLVAPETVQSVKAINGAKLYGQDSELSFIIDRETRRLVIRLVDINTRKVIRQIPTEEVLRRAANLPRV